MRNEALTAAGADAVARLAGLIELGNELTGATDERDLCRIAVERGREHLRFDRLGLWLLTDEPGAVTGSYGVDHRGGVIDESNLRSQLTPDDPEWPVLCGRKDFVVIGEAPFEAGQGPRAGVGEQVVAAISHGLQPLGHVSADNRVSRRPIERIQCELLRLFGSILGAHYVRARTERERLTLIEELRAASSKIHTLSGLIPICAKCKKIRDDQGYWNRLEVYLRDHSGASFSHGLCPDCERDFYAGL